MKQTLVSINVFAGGYAFAIALNFAHEGKAWLSFASMVALVFNLGIASLIHRSKEL